jgi:hypothetical protein
MSLQRDIDHAWFQADRARGERVEMRWRQTPGSTEREATIRTLLHEITQAMKPLRSAIGKLVFRDDEACRHEDDLRAVSQRLQYERKQLNKMLR